MKKLSSYWGLLIPNKETFELRGLWTQHPEGVSKPLLSHLLPITTHLLQRNSHIKKNREERKVTVPWHTGISHKLTVQEAQCRNQESNTKRKKKLSHKWLLTSADNSDRPNTIPALSIWQGKGENSIHGDEMFAWEHQKIFLCFKDFA